MIPAYQLLARRIQAEVNELERSVRRAERAWKAARDRPGDQDMYVDSAALNLHGFYSGLERLFEYIANQLDGVLPKGEAWHRELLRQMAVELTGVRPAVISPDAAKALDEYRRFRHVVRNVYAEHLDPKKISKLVSDLATLWEQVKSELTQFIGFLEGASRADDAVPE